MLVGTTDPSGICPARLASVSAVASAAASLGKATPIIFRNTFSRYAFTSGPFRKRFGEISRRDEM